MSAPGSARLIAEIANGVAEVGFDTLVKPPVIALELLKMRTVATL